MALPADIRSLSIHTANRTGGIEIFALSLELNGRRWIGA